MNAHFSLHYAHAYMYKHKIDILTIHGQAGGTGPQNTNWSQRLLSTKKNVDRRKSRNTNSYTNFFEPYELEIRNCSQIRIRIYVLDVFAVKIRIGLIFPPIRRIRGGEVQYPLAQVWYEISIFSSKFDKICDRFGHIWLG